MQKQYATIGEIYTVNVGWSEAAIFTKISGTIQNVLVISPYCGTLVNEAGAQISAPYLLSELGFFTDATGYYINTPSHEIA